MHEIFMKRALELAALGAGSVSPNPLVGAVLVSEGRIIGEGFHGRFGAAHAEIEALNSVPEGYRAQLPRSTLYVSLEPCCTYGHTPPCTERIIREGIPSVVVAMRDPNPHVNGQGIAGLHEAGITVTEGILTPDAEWMNRRFATAQRAGRPYIILKWAQTTDGFVGRPGMRDQISGPLTNRLVHKWRSEEDAVLVGTQTALVDNPRLTVRLWPGRNPKRVVLDRKKVLGADLHLFDKEAPTIALSRAADASQIVQQLHGVRVLSVLVEGGPTILRTFIEANLWDEARVIISRKRLHQGLRAPEMQQPPFGEEFLGNDRLRFFVNT